MRKTLLGTIAPIKAWMDSEIIAFFESDYSKNRDTSSNRFINISSNKSFKQAVSLIAIFGERETCSRSFREASYLFVSHGVFMEDLSTSLCIARVRFDASARWSSGFPCVTHNGERKERRAHDSVVCSRSIWRREANVNPTCATMMDRHALI